MNILPKVGDHVTVQFVRRLVYTIGGVFLLLAVCLVWLSFGTVKYFDTKTKLEEQILATDIVVDILEASIERHELEAFAQLSELDTRLVEAQHEIEVLQAQVEIIDESINGREKRNAKRNVVIAAIKATLPESGNPIVGCPKAPSPGEIWSIAGAIVDHSEDYSVPASLVAAVIRQESAFCNKAVSPVGAKGYMQLMPETAAQVSADVAVKTGRALRTWRGRDNIQLGVAYLSEMLLEFDGDPLLAARAYNGGPTHVKKVLAGISGPYTCKDGSTSQFYCETEHYGTYVMTFKAEYERLGL